MAKKVKPEVIRKRMSSELLSLNRVLNQSKSGVFHNPEVLLASANQCSKGEASKWHYEVAELILNVSVPQNVLPQTSHKSMIVTANINIYGDCDDDAEDCLTGLEFNIDVSMANRENFCSWHFDRHITSEEGHDPEEAHPLYHFQHGGHAMKEIAGSLGKVLLLPAPRVAFPPLDATLAIDFLLSNFAGSAWQELRNDPTYSRLLRDAQERCWKPYITRLAKWWDPGPREDEHKTLALWPQLI